MEKFQKAVELFKAKTQKDCYKIEIVRGKPDILDDKLGGQPYLPIGEEYPTADGKPLDLLLQVNLKNISLPNFPTSGILEVFTNNDWPCKFAIKLFDEGREYQKKFPKLDYKYPFISKAQKITLSKGIAHMSLNDGQIDSVLCPILNEVYGVEVESLMDFIDLFEDDTGWRWHEDFYNQLACHKMTLGGYPDFTQTDPREDDSELCECLFKIDSGIERVSEISIGDSGIIFGLISSQELSDKNFSNALVDWDCC